MRKAFMYIWLVMLVVLLLAIPAILSGILAVHLVDFIRNIQTYIPAIVISLLVILVIVFIFKWEI